MVAEMEKLKELLTNNNIEWADRSDLTQDDFYHIDRIHFKINGEKWSAINGYGTKGGVPLCSLTEYNKGLIEIMSFKSNSPIGWLTAEEVMSYVLGVKNII